MAKWGFVATTALLLLAWALAPWGETQVTPATSLEMADGKLTVRLWGDGPRAPAGEAIHAERGWIVPDTTNIPLVVLLALLAVPAVALWWWDRRRPAAA